MLYKLDTVDTYRCLDLFIKLDTIELCWRNRTTKLGKLSVLIGVYHDQENKNLQ